MNNQEEFCFYVYNIRLLTDRERGPATYKRLFHKLYGLRRPVPVDKFCYMTLKPIEECHIAGTPVLRGYLGRIGAKTINRRYNPRPSDVENQYRVMEYLFIPVLHRLCLLMRLDKVSLLRVREYLNAALNRAARQDEKVHVTLEKSREFLEHILGARDILDITLQVSFSNQDLNDEYTNLVDNQLRDAEIERLEISGRARDGKSVNLTKSEFLMGAAGLVPSNGHAWVQIVNREGKKETVDTSDYPRIFRVHCGEGEKAEAVVHQMLNTYPRRNEA